MKASFHRARCNPLSSGSCSRFAPNFLTADIVCWFLEPTSNSTCTTHTTPSSNHFPAQSQSHNLLDQRNKRLHQNNSVNRNKAAIHNSHHLTSATIRVREESRWGDLYAVTVVVFATIPIRTSYGPPLNSTRNLPSSSTSYLIIRRFQRGPEGRILLLPAPNS